jgi:hypothetical protein
MNLGIDAKPFKLSFHPIPLHPHKHSLTFVLLLPPTTSTQPRQIAFGMHVASPQKPDATISYRQSISFELNEVDLGA